jgi:LPXTG-motif cell wall-anchored protein
MTTTTIVDTGTPPTLPTPWTAPTIDYREALTPHRSLPDTGNGVAISAVGLVVLVVGVVLVRWARRRRLRYYVIRAGEGRWAVVTDQTWVTSYGNRDAARYYAQVLNAGRIGGGL